MKVGDAKTCPDCAEQVQAAARVCRYCGFRFEAFPAPEDMSQAATPASEQSPITTPQSSNLPDGLKKALATPWRCPECGCSEIPGNKWRCEKCGAHRSGGGTESSPRSTPRGFTKSSTGSGAWRCRACGVMGLRSEVEACPRCGAAKSAAIKALRTDPTPKNTGWNAPPTRVPPPSARTTPQSNGPLVSRRSVIIAAVLGLAFGAFKSVTGLTDSEKEEIRADIASEVRQQDAEASGSEP